MSNALMMAIAGCLRPAKAPKVVLVGTCGLNGSASIVQYTLPTGCLVNDVVVCGFAYDAPTGNTLTPPANAVALVNGVTTSNMQVYLYRIPLTATDITNDYVAFTWGGASTAFVPGAVFRNVSVSKPLDGTVSQALQSVAVALPFSATAPGITTTTPGCMLVQCAAMTPTSADGGMVMAPPSGFSNLFIMSPLQIDATLNCLAQTTSGATGNITSACTGSAGTQASWGAWLFALRPTTPAITLSATFPSSPHVGDAVSFDVTATPVDGATGTLTITVDALPDGLTLGSTTDNGDGTFTATVSGTLTTVQDITATFGATGGSVSATPLAHDFDVTASVTAASYVGASIITSASSNATLPTGCQAGDWLFIAPTTNVTVTLSAPSSAASVIADMDFTLGSGHRHLAVWRYKLTATDITNGYVAITTNANRSQLVVARSSQATNPVDVSNTNSNSGTGTKPASVTVGGVTTTADGALLLLIDSVLPAGSATGTFAVSGWTVALTLNDALYKGGVAYLAQSTAGATGSVTATFDNNNFASSGAALIAVKP